MFAVGQIRDLKKSDDFFAEVREGYAVFGKFQGFVFTEFDITPEIKDYLDNSCTSVEDALENAKIGNAPYLVIYTTDMENLSHSYIDGDVVAAISRAN